MRLAEINSYLDNHTPISDWDKGVFGSLCILLNVIALCFLALPSSGRHDIESNGRLGIQSAVEARLAKITRTFRVFGPTFWAMSFLSLLMYLDPIYAYVASGQQRQSFAI